MPAHLAELDLMAVATLATALSNKEQGGMTAADVERMQDLVAKVDHHLGSL